MYNKITLVGRLVVDPEAKMTPSGVAVTQFRIAVDRPVSQEARQSGERTADFIDIVCWRQNAEYAAKYLTKGRLILVEGRLQIREYVTNDGQKRKATEVVANDLKGMPTGQGQRDTEGDGYDDGYGDGYAPSRGGGNGYGGGGGYDRAPAAPAAPARSGGGGYSGARGGRTQQDDYGNGDDLSDPFAE
jgi:single-strand DNA-binding protein